MTAPIRVGLEEAVVYRMGTGGRFTEEDQRLEVHIFHYVRLPTEIGGGRQELSLFRKMVWYTDYEPPRVARVRVQGDLWEVRPGTLYRRKGPNGTVMLRRIDIHLVADT